MNRLCNALGGGLKGGLIAFVVTFIIGGLLAAGMSYANPAHPPTPSAVRESIISVGLIMGCSFAALYFGIMFVGGLIDPKPRIQ